MGVEYQQQGRSLLDDTPSGMLATVYPPGVRFRLAEPPFQFIVVYRQLLASLESHPREQATGKTTHELGTVRRECVPLPLVLALQLPEPGLAPPPWPFVLFQSLCHRTDLFDLLGDLLLLLFHPLQASVNTCRQPS